MNKQELREMIAQEVTAHTPPPPPVQRRVYSILDCDVPFFKAFRWIVTVWCSMVAAVVFLMIWSVIMIALLTGMLGGSQDSSSVDQSPPERIELFEP